MKPTPFVNKFIRSTIPNTISAQRYQLLMKLRIIVVRP